METKDDQNAALLNRLWSEDKFEEVERIRTQLLEEGLIYNFHPHKQQYFLQFNYSEEVKD